MTGGGTIGTGKTPTWSYGGMVYPGCTPKAAAGGNWNVVEHATGLHFQGQQITVICCSGDPTKSPRVEVRTINFQGTGILSGIGGNPEATIKVTSVAQVTDNQDGGKTADTIYLQVKDSSSVVRRQIGTAGTPMAVSTGNLQIHTTGCSKYVN
jgi:hypothetical protein